MKPIKLLLLSILMAWILIPGSTTAKKVYKWVDEKGVVHFSDRQPGQPDRVKGAIEERDIKESSPVELPAEPAIEEKPKNPIEHAIDSTFTIKGTKSIGTGFFISSHGYAATCRHVIEGKGTLTAVLNDQTEYPIDVVSMSDKNDIAIILVLTPSNMPYISFKKPKTLNRGERLFAIGTSAGLQATITDGVFTGVRQRKSTGEKLIQFSAPINPGNSGGPLVDEKGSVVGVVSSKYILRQGVPVSGVGFAVPSEDFIKEYRTYAE